MLWVCRPSESLAEHLQEILGFPGGFADFLNANLGICRDLSRRGSVRPSKRENEVRVSCCAEKPHLLLSIEGDKRYS
jgi:hypothetical protein